MEEATSVGSMSFTKPTDRVLVGTRHIDAPRELVWGVCRRAAITTLGICEERQ